MDINFLLEFINPIILGICLVMGYCIKLAFDWIDNKYIPLAAATVGVGIAMALNLGDINAQVILGGMISGLASTGLYEMLRNLMRHDGKSDNEVNIMSEADRGKEETQFKESEEV